MRGNHRLSIAILFVVASLMLYLYAGGFLSLQTGVSLIPHEKWTFLTNTSYNEVAFPHKANLKLNLAPPRFDKSYLPDSLSLYIDDPSMLEPFKRLNLTEQEKKHWAAEKQLLPNAVPSIINFVWCNKELFTFFHYLTVVSAIRTIIPAKVVVHYHEIPQIDGTHYNLWIKDLVHDYPFLNFERLSVGHRVLCQKDKDASTQYKYALMDLLNKEGGIFIGFHTWILEFPPSLRQTELRWAIRKGSLEGYAIMKKGYIDNITFTEGLAKPGNYCTTIHKFYKTKKRSNCLIVLGNQYEMMYPYQIWKLDNPFGEVVRKIMYGTRNIIQATPSYNELVPNIAHMVVSGGIEMNFMFYLSILSLLYVAKVDKVYIHGDNKPTGPYWEKVIEIRNVIFILRQMPISVYQGKIDKGRQDLMSDLIRADLMIKYGGIFTDRNAIWVKPLSREDRGYDAVAALDWVDWDYPFPDVVNSAVSYGKRNAPYWRIFLNSMKSIDEQAPGYSSVKLPYKILEHYPHLLHINPHLNVICYHLKCHPTWVKGYHDENNNHVSNNTLQHWKSDVHAFLWTYPQPKEFTDMTTLLGSKGLFADIGKHVLRHAGLLK